MRIVRNCIVLFFALYAYGVQSQPVNPFGKALIPDMIADASIQEIEAFSIVMPPPMATTMGYERRDRR